VEEDGRRFSFDADRFLGFEDFLEPCPSGKGDLLEGGPTADSPSAGPLSLSVSTELRSLIRSRIQTLCREEVTNRVAVIARAYRGRPQTLEEPFLPQSSRASE
jgi:hypothetical protein